MSATDYESTRLLDEYLLFHYGEPERLLPWAEGPRGALEFPRRCVEETLAPGDLPPTARALDLGCAVGRASFELSRHCAEVVGIDYSRTFITAARALARGESLAYRVKETGDWHEPAEARLPAGVNPERVRFEVGDAHAVREDVGDFDVVLACNLLCRLREPRLLLARLPRLVRPGGWLVLTTPHSWMEEFTAKESWLGARQRGEAPLAVIEASLAPAFALERHRDLPFLIREHARKFQWSVAEASVWRRQPNPTAENEPFPSATVPTP
jgi:putative 4-mercaptohistidine N1-methyltranferase